MKGGKGKEFQKSSRVCNVLPWIHKRESFMPRLQDSLDSQPRVQFACWFVLVYFLARVKPNATR